MICIQCGSSNPDHATYCGKCGGQLAKPSHIPPSSPGQPGYKAPSKLMPIWVLIGSIVLVALLLIVLQLTGSDWAAGAMRVGIVAGILALLILLITVVRMILGRATKSNPAYLTQLISAVLVILLLSLLCLVGLTQQSVIHNLQAHSWEGQQQWQSAINQYQLSGEGAPTSENVARVYNLWGERFTSHQQYVEALAKYNIVLTYYGSASTGVARAQSDSITAYFAWGQQASQQHDYPDAINNFHILVSRFANSTEAHKVHGEYAKALLGEGKQQLNTASCTSAIPTYQQ